MNHQGEDALSHVIRYDVDMPNRRVRFPFYSDKMIKYIEDKDINQEEIINALGENVYGDEDFSIFKCPKCGRIYLIDYEVDTIFTDAKNLLVMKHANNFLCVTCQYDFREEIIIGDKADDYFKVTWGEMNSSDWRWIVIQS